MRLLIPLSEESKIPLYQQIASRVKELINTGNLTAGTRMPSSRELAETLSVSRVTTNQAYNLLLREGFIETKPAVGTFVKAQSKTVVMASKNLFKVQSSSDRLSEYGFRILESDEIEPARLELFPELNYSASALDDLPLATWRDVLLKTTRKRHLSTRSYLSDEFGHLGLRQAISSYLARSRGIQCLPEQIAVFAGTQPALDLIARVLINQGDRVAVENPGFPGARRTFSSYGARLVPVAVDQDGMITSGLKKDPSLKAAYVTPAHHDPLGVIMSKERRKTMLAWSKSNNSFIIEDDFDCEFNYARQAVQALKAEDLEQTVVYLYGFWKVLFPIARLGIAVFPEPLLPVMRRAKSLIERDFHFIEHDALASFIEEGYLEKHIRRLTTVYARRRLKLMGSLHKHCGSFVQISALTAGTHIIVSFPKQTNQQSVLETAAATGVHLVPLRPYYWQSSEKDLLRFLMPFAHLRDEFSSDAAIKRFAHEAKSILL